MAQGCTPIWAPIGHGQRVNWYEPHVLQIDSSVRCSRLCLTGPVGAPNEADLARVRPGSLSRWLTLPPGVLVGEQSSRTCDGAEVLPLSARGGVPSQGWKSPIRGDFTGLRVQAPPRTRFRIYSV